MCALKTSRTLKHMESLYCLWIPDRFVLYSYVALCTAMAFSLSFYPGKIPSHRLLQKCVCVFTINSYKGARQDNERVHRNDAYSYVSLTSQLILVVTWKNFTLINFRKEDHREPLLVV